MHRHPTLAECVAPQTGEFDHLIQDYLDAVAALPDDVYGRAPIMDALDNTKVLARLMELNTRLGYATRPRQRKPWWKRMRIRARLSAAWQAWRDPDIIESEWD